MKRSPPLQSNCVVNTVLRKEGARKFKAMKTKQNKTKQCLYNPLRASLLVQAVKNMPAMQTKVQSLVRKIPWRREWQPIPAFLPGEFHGQRSLVGYSPWSHKELDMTEQLTLSFHFHNPT